MKTIVALYITTIVLKVLSESYEILNFEVRPYTPLTTLR